MFKTLISAIFIASALAFVLLPYGLASAGMSGKPSFDEERMLPDSFTAAAVPFPPSNGVLDATFGVNGIINTPIGIGNDVAQAVAIQADGKIVVAGYAFNGTNDDFAIVRYNPNGTLDDTFDGTTNGNGIILTGIGSGNDEAFGIALQPDGKIVVVGQTSGGAKSDFAVVRYNPDGTLDTTFDGDGRAVVSVSTSNATARSVAIQSDGKIVVAGSGLNANFDTTVVRLTATGQLDASFKGNSGNGNGVVVTPVGTGNDQGYSVAVQPDGKIVVGGYFSGSLSTDTVVLRYNADGTLDTTFDGDGIATHAFSPDTDEGLAMALQPDGKIVIAGCIRAGAPNDFLFARFDQNGGVDSTFGTNGLLIVPFSGVADIALGVAIQADGKIVAAGFGSNGSNNDFAVARVNSNGTIDTTFNGNGRVLTMIGTSTDSANAVAIQADGKIVVVGRAVIGSTADFGVVRYGYGTNAQANDGFFDLDSTTAIRFDNAFQRGNTSVSLLTPAAVQPLPAGLAFAVPPRMIETSASFSGNITVKITMPADISATSFDRATILQGENGNWVDKTAVVPPRDFATKSVYAGVSSLSVIAAVLPGAASVSGRVLTPSGSGLRNARVTLTDPQGLVRTAMTSSFGAYRFDDIVAGQTYGISVRSKRYRFAPRSIPVSDSLADLDFVGIE